MSLCCIHSREATPLQIQQYLTMALVAGFQTGKTPQSADLIESVLRQLDDLEPSMTRHGYQIKDLAELQSAATQHETYRGTGTLDSL